MILLTPHDFGLRIKERRRDLGWTQAELSRLAGVSRSFLGDVEAGKPTVELGRCLAVLRALGLNTDVRVGAVDREGSSSEVDPRTLRASRAHRYG